MDAGLAFACLFRNVPAIFRPGKLDVGKDNINVLGRKKLNSRLSPRGFQNQPILRPQQAHDVATHQHLIFDDEGGGGGTG